MKKFVSVLMAVAMVACMLAGCGSSTTSTSASATESTATEGTETSATGTFKLGSCGPLTGSAAIYGQAVMNGINIAVEEINAEGGIQFEFKSEDDEADGEKSVNAYNTLMDWGMQVLVGPVTTGASITVANEANNDGVFMLTPSASSTDVIKDKDNVFQVCFTDPNQGVASADYMAENFADKKIGIIYRSDDAYSAGIRETFLAEAGAKGLNVVYDNGAFTSSSDTDFSVQLTGAKEAGADMLFLPIYYTPASVILKQANDMGYAPTFFGVDGMDGILTVEGFDTSLAEGVMLLTPFSADAEDEKTQNFVKKYTEEYGETPNQFAADAYDGVYIVKAALEAAGCTADMSAEDICNALVAVMPTITVDGLTGTGMTWAATGEVSKAPRAVVIKDGAYVTP